VDGLLPGVDRDEHLLDAAEVGRRVFGEAAGEEGTRGIVACEEVVTATGPVGCGRDGNVVDCAVESEVDGAFGRGAVVGEELGVG
jgi:hypothetical protein